MTRKSPSPDVGRFARILMFSAGIVCLILAGLGAILPVLPTTPFLLLSAILFLRSSDRMYRWMHENRIFGEYLRRYRAGLGIPLATKISTLLFLWATLGTSAVFFIPARIRWVGIILALIGTLVTIHILRVPTFRKNGNQSKQI